MRKKSVLFWLPYQLHQVTFSQDSDQSEIAWNYKAKGKGVIRVNSVTNLE